MPPKILDADVATALANLARDSELAAANSQSVEFGTGEQPELAILQLWKQFRVPAPQMQAMNACRMGHQSTLAIYFDNDDKPEPENMLLCLCKATNQGTHLPCLRRAAILLWRQCQALTSMQQTGNNRRMLPT